MRTAPRAEGTLCPIPVESSAIVPNALNGAEAQLCRLTLSESRAMLLAAMDSGIVGNGRPECRDRAWPMTGRRFDAAARIHITP
jgi:hypothetical protein